MRLRSLFLTLFLSALSLCADEASWPIPRDISVVDIHYKPTTYEKWSPMKSGLTALPRPYNKKKLLLTQPL